MLKSKTGAISAVFKNIKTMKLMVQLWTVVQQGENSNSIIKCTSCIRPKNDLF